MINYRTACVYELNSSLTTSANHFPSDLRWSAVSLRRCTLLTPITWGPTTCRTTLKSRLLSLQPRATSRAHDYSRISKSQSSLALVFKRNKIRLCANLQAGKLFESSSETSLKANSSSRLAWTLQSWGIALGGTTGRSFDLCYPNPSTTLTALFVYFVFSFIFIILGIGGFPSESRHLERGNIFLWYVILVSEQCF